MTDFYSRIYVHVSDYPKVAGETPFDVLVDWGDGHVSEFTDLYSVDLLEHDYEAPGNYVINVELVNSCDRVVKHLPVTVFVPGQRAGGTHVYTFDLDVYDVKPADDFAHNFPGSVTVVGNAVITHCPDIENPLLALYSIDVVLRVLPVLSSSNTQIPIEIVKYPTKYEIIPKDDVIVTAPSNDFQAFDNILYILAEQYANNYAQIAEDREVLVCFKYIMDSNDVGSNPLLFGTQVTGDVTIYGNEDMVNRIRCDVPGDISGVMGVPSLVESDELEARGWSNFSDFAIWKTVVSFGEIEIPGFTVRVAERSDVGKWLDVDISIMSPNGTFGRIKPALIDCYQKQFVYPVAELSKTKTDVDVLVAGGSSGVINVASSERIDMIEMIVSAGGITRVIHDSVKPLHDNRYLLTILNKKDDTEGNMRSCNIQILNDLNEFTIYRLDLFQKVGMLQEDMPVQLSVGNTLTRCDGVYYMISGKTIDVDTGVCITDTLVSMHNVDFLPLLGDGVLDSLFGKIKIETNYGTLTANVRQKIET